MRRWGIGKSMPGLSCRGTVGPPLGSAFASAVDALVDTDTGTGNGPGGFAIAWELASCGLAGGMLVMSDKSQYTLSTRELIHS